MKILLTLLGLILILQTQTQAQETKPYAGKFEQLGNMITPPSPYRTAAGAPGKDYWQQRANYVIKTEIDEKTNTLLGEETITYFNNSPDDLDYVWVQLEQNVNKPENEDFGDFWGDMKDSISSRNMQIMVRPLEYKAGTEIKSVVDGDGEDLKFMVNNTMMRVNLNETLKAGSQCVLNIKWINHITDRSNFFLSREGYEYFPEDGNTVYLMGHWFPRMAVYNDTEGWQNKQFQRLGEFALEFGDYQLEITVPADHIVASTGALQNEKEVLTKEQQARLAKAKTSFDQPLMIITPEEAKANEKTKSTKKQTWKFKADNVRDVAFASSRKFIWDAQAVKLPTNTVMAMSFYPNEGLPVWTEESTKAIKHALEVYSEATFDYPYPVAISVNTSNVGIEYPMISFNGGRPQKGEISESARIGMLSTIIHEVGHNWFPMIVSSDERQWMWMDEGLNTFLHQRTLEERYPQYPHTTPETIVDYMKGDKEIMRPIMVGADNGVNNFGNNFYRKPTVAFQILRNNVVGKEFFDQAFKEYANLWKYKHPNPADFFRTIENASATDLDWFWRGWFFTTDHVDMDLANVKWFKVKEDNVAVENKGKKIKSGNMSAQNVGQLGGSPELINMMPSNQTDYGQFLSRLDEGQIRENLKGKNIYELTIQNKGGLVMPIIISWNFVDGTKEIETLPAEVWRHNEAEVIKTFMKAKEVATVTLDPHFQLADTETDNNTFPRQTPKSRLDDFKSKGSGN